MEPQQLARLPQLVMTRNLLHERSAHAQVLTSLAQVRDEIAKIEGFPEDHALLSAWFQQQQQLVDQAVQLNNQQDDHQRACQDEINSLALELITDEWFQTWLEIGDATIGEQRQQWKMSELELGAVLLALNNPDVWRYPTMCINAQHPELTDLVSVGSIFYLVECDLRIMQRALGTYDADTQRKIRAHSVVNFSDMDLGANESLTQWGIPDLQIGHAVCWNMFTRFTMERMRKVLDQIMPKIRPGGSIIFDINDADSHMGAVLVANRVVSYMTRPLMERLASDLGLTITGWYPVFGHRTVCVKLTRAGELSSAIAEPSKGVIRKS